MKHATNSFWMMVVQKRVSDRAVSLCACLLLSAFALGHTTPQRISKTNPKPESTVIASGEVRPIRYVKLTSDVRGHIKEIYVKPGDRVEKGQPLVLIQEQSRELKNMKQYSPLRGVVTDISTRVDELVGRRTGPLMMIADMARINVEIAVDDSEIKLVRLGQSAKIVVDAFQEEEIQGVVSGKRPLPVRFNEPREFAVMIEMRGIPADIRDRLLPGMSATAWIKVGS